MAERSGATARVNLNQRTLPDERVTSGDDFMGVPVATSFLDRLVGD
jgi:hypothetical protein